MASKNAQAGPWDGTGCHVVVLKLQLLLHHTEVKALGACRKPWCLPTAEELLQPGTAARVVTLMSLILVSRIARVAGGCAEQIADTCCRQQQCHSGRGDRLYSLLRCRPDIHRDRVR